jgi:hypothetical protein
VPIGGWFAKAGHCSHLGVLSVMGILQYLRYCCLYNPFVNVLQPPYTFRCKPRRVVVPHTSREVVAFYEMRRLRVRCRRARRANEDAFPRSYCGTRLGRVSGTGKSLSKMWEDGPKRCRSGPVCTMGCWMKLPRTFGHRSLRVLSAKGMFQH